MYFLLLSELNKTEEKPLVVNLDIVCQQGGTVWVVVMEVVTTATTAEMTGA